MSDGQSFILILSAFYLWESIYWVRPHSVSFVRYFNRWKQSVATDLLYGRRRAIFFSPLPGLFFPQFIGSELPYTFNSATLKLTGGALLSWDELQIKQEGSTLYFNKKYKFDFPSGIQAAASAQLLHDFAQTPEVKRTKHIREFYRKQLSSTRSKRIIQKAKIATSTLRFNGVFLILLCFAIIPYSYIFNKGSLHFAITLAITICFVIFQAFLAYFVARRLYPGKRKYSLIIGLSSLFPWQAIHVGQHLLSNALSLQHPLAISAALLSPKDLCAQISSYWRKMEYGPNQNLSPLFKNELQEFLKREGIEKESLFLAPEKSSKETASYCPCCQAQFREGFSTCSDCKEVSLITFNKE
ncbi:MAG: hypothetical protein O3C43_08715 [Verrucomicrobia bacterium]|nr:hypothetical protein [Verrucomicrobiota bacterium]MDA1066569.1 hypothetical protein [Verrucomicrobiota bacterium]